MKTPALMIQGTTSDAGKSIITAAFCRIFTRRGFRVAPFKSQNMSNNAAVTHLGGEIGRAQAVQALACNRAPDVRMNPILLKPSSDVGCQVVVLGHPIGNATAISYENDKNGLFETVKSAYDSLASEVDLVILEGAGSPAEINLMERDIANMKMAAHAEASVIIVGDIDRGGVYAHFIGTLACLYDADRPRVKGFLVNKFRGDISFLGAAHEMILERTGVPVIGTVPYLHDIAIPEEDAFAFKTGFSKTEPSRPDFITVALVDLPHLANQNDFEPLALEPDVQLIRATEPAHLAGADLIILPGSKNVPSDAEKIRSKGLYETIRSIYENGSATIVGICGGFQILGREISDPLGIESSSLATEGIGLFDMKTVLEKEKVTTLVRGVHDSWNCPFHGYEIHHGKTDCSQLIPIGHRETVPVLWSDSQNRLFGTYLHGIFDGDQFRRTFIDTIRERKGLEPLKSVQVSYDVDAALDRLADLVERSVDMEAILKMVGK